MRRAGSKEVCGAPCKHTPELILAWLSGLGHHITLRRRTQPGLPPLLPSTAASERLLSGMPGWPDPQRQTLSIKPAGHSVSRCSYIMLYGDRKGQGGQREKQQFRRWPVEVPECSVVQGIRAEVKQAARRPDAKNGRGCPKQRGHENWRLPELKGEDGVIEGEQGAQASRIQCSQAT